MTQTTERAVAMAAKVEAFVRDVVVPYERDPRCGSHGPPMSILKGTLRSRLYYGPRACSARFKIAGRSLHMRGWPAASGMLVQPLFVATECEVDEARIRAASCRWAQTTESEAIRRVNDDTINYLTERSSCEAIFSILPANIVGRSVPARPIRLADHGGVAKFEALLPLQSCPCDARQLFGERDQDDVAVGPREHAPEPRSERRLALDERRHALRRG